MRQRLKLKAKPVRLTARLTRFMVTKIALCLLVLLNYQGIRAAGYETLRPGQFVIDYQSPGAVSLYARQAKKTEILNQLTKYITLELYLEAELDGYVSIEIKEQPLSRILLQVLDGSNHITRYRQNPAALTVPPGLQLQPISAGPESTKIQSSIPMTSVILNPDRNNNYMHPVEIIEDQQDEMALKSIGSMIATAGPEQKMELCHLLADIGNTRAIGFLEKLIQDKHAPVRQQAIYALGDIGSGQAAKVLAIAVTDQTEELRLLAISELAQIRTVESLDALKLALSDQDPGIRIDAVNALGEHNTPSSVELLWSLVRSDNLTLAATANEILTRKNQH